MANLVRLSDHRRSKAKRVSFDRQELRQLLDVYSRRVASGEWKDYAIDMRHGAAIFSIFRHTFDRPVFAVAKRGQSIGEVLSTFDKPLRLISRR